MIEHVYDNVIIADLAEMKFTDWENEEESDNFCKLAEELAEEVNNLLETNNINAFAINGVNIIGSNFKIYILSPEEFSPYESDEVVVQLRSDGEEKALFILDANKKYAFRHYLVGNVVSVFEMDGGSNAETN